MVTVNRWTALDTLRGISISFLLMTNHCLINYCFTSLGARFLWNLCSSLIGPILKGLERLSRSTVHMDWYGSIQFATNCHSIRKGMAIYKIEKITKHLVVLNPFLIGYHKKLFQTVWLKIVPHRRTMAWDQLILVAIAGSWSCKLFTFVFTILPGIYGVDSQQIISSPALRTVENWWMG